MIADEVGAIVDRVRKSTIPEDSWPDLCADIKHAESLLRSLRQGYESEVSAPIVGEAFRFSRGRSATRSYNTSALLGALSQPSETLSATIARLVDADVLRIAWQWRNLQRQAVADDVSLTVAAHEIDDGTLDGEGRPVHVGEVWETKYELKPK